MSNHTKGAIRAAEIITGDTYATPKGKYDTDHGQKTVVGIADLIDSETAAPALLAACRRVLRAIHWASTEDRLTAEEQADLLRAAIAKATQ